MQIESRKTFSSSKLKRRLLEKLSKRRKLKIGSHTIMFLTLSYFAYMKKLSKMSSLNALTEKKLAIYRKNLAEAHQTILRKTRVKKTQKTLDEMFKRRSYQKNET